MVLSVCGTVRLLLVRVAICRLIEVPEYEQCK
jgi:hypothetical protein